METENAAVDQRLIELVEKLSPMRPTRIVLFGSTARGDSDTYSDLDVVVVAECVPERFSDRIAAVYELVDPRYGLDVFIYTPAEYNEMLEDGNPLVNAAEREGRLLYERSPA